jgi:microsomal dipeptidase-like Zn-dependent dipeptidase
MTRALKAMAIVVLLLGLALFFFVVPGEVARQMNPVSGPPPRFSAKADALHRRLLIADLHADSLLWGRDLARRAATGHVDVPRLVDANVALQAFTIVTKTPRGINIERNDDLTDNIFWLALAQRWPPATWRSLLARALHQAQRLRDVEARSAGRLVLIRTRADLATYLERRKLDSARTAGLLGVEGAQALDGRLENLDVLFDAGIRMMAPTHFFDTDIGGSAAGVQKGGLTPLGREWVKAMESKRMLVDLAHASSSTIDDVLALARRPVVVSHTGVRGTCDNARNLSDAQLRAVARNGGLVGIGFFSTATCGDDAASIVRAIVYTANLVGLDHVALGSDFDGAITAPFDVTGLPAITEALLTQGYGEEDVGRIMGGNVMRVLGDQLP